MSYRANTFAFVTLELYPTTVGGAGILLHHTITALLRNGHRVVLYLDLAEQEIQRFDQRDRHTYPNPHGLSFYDVRAMSRALEFGHALYDDAEQFRSISIAHAILSTQDKHDIDLIEFYDYCGPAFHYLSYNAAVRRPVAIRLHNTTEIIERGTRSVFDKRRLFAYAMERAQLTLADLVLSPGPAYLSDEVRKLYRQELKNQEVALAPPIHPSIGAVTYSTEGRRILFYGRLSTFKGLDIFINAAVLALQNPQFRAWLDVFLIVGPEETVASALTLDEMKSVISAEFADKFRFVGRVTHTQLLQTLADASFACFANRMESFCYAAHELHTAGIPLILADRPAFRDHFTSDDVVFAGRTATEMAAAMIALAGDPEKRARLSARALALVEPDGADLYLEFAAQAGAHRADAIARGKAHPDDRLLTVFILSDGDGEAEAITRASLPGAAFVTYVLRLSDAGLISYAGLRWSPAVAGDLLGPVTAAYMFVRAGDVCHAEILREAARHLLQDDRVGAIAPWCEVAGRVRPALHAFVPEYAAIMGPGLRTLIRAPGGTTVVELLHAGSFADETSALLAQRADSRGLVEKPVVGVVIDRSIYLPPPRSDPGVDYDRMSPFYLALSRGLVPAANAGARVPVRRPRTPFPGYDMISVRATEAFGAGELWVLRIFSRRGTVHESWSAISKFGEWMLIEKEPTSPAGGALKTYDGEICFWADQDYGIEFLFGPFCSGVEISWHGCVYHVRLKRDFVTSAIVWLGELRRGLFQPPEKACAPIREIGRCTLREGAKAWIEANIDTRTRSLVLTRNPAMSSSGDPNTVVVLPSTLVDAETYMTGDLVFALLAVTAKAPRCAIQFPFDLPHVSQIADLVLQGGGSSVIVDVDDQQAGQNAHTLYRALAGWTGVVDTHGDKMNFIGSNDDLLYPLQEMGARITRRAYRLPACPWAEVEAGNEVDLVILRSDGLINNVAHMVAGAAFLAVHGTRVATLYLEEGQHHAAHVCETLSAACALASYRSLESVVALPRNRRLLACAVYPDSSVPPQAARALSLGTPTLLGPIGQTRPFCAALSDMSVPFWEDARDIGQALARLAANTPAIVRAYNDAVGKQP